MNTWRSISSKKIESLIKWKVCVAQRSFPLDYDQLTEDASGLGAGDEVAQGRAVAECGRRLHSECRRLDSE